MEERAPRGGATARRWSPSTTLTSPACSGECARASGRPSGGRRIHKKHGRRPQANHQGRLRGSPHRFRQHSADAAAGPGARPQHLQRGGEGVSGRPPGEPGPAAERLQQLRVSGAHEPAAGGPGRHEGLRRQALPLHAGGHRRAHQESGRGAAEGPSCEHHRGGHEEGLRGCRPTCTPTTAPSSRGSSRS